MLLILDKFLFHCHVGTVTYWTERCHQIHAWEISPFNVQVTINCSTISLCKPGQITLYSRWHGRHFPISDPCAQLSRTWERAGTNENWWYDMKVQLSTLKKLFLPFSWHIVMKPEFSQKREAREIWKPLCVRDMEIKDQFLCLLSPWKTNV